MQRPILLLLAVILTLILVAGAGVAMLFVSLMPPSESGTEQSFTIQKGEGVKEVAAALKRGRLIKSTFAFETYVWLEGSSTSFQAGEYLVSPMMSSQELMSLFTRGDTASRETVITIPEGWTLRQIGSYLVNEKKLFTQDAWEAAADATDSRTLIPGVTYTFLSDKPASATLEGYLFPDTYRVFKNASPADVMKKMLDGFGVRVDEATLAQIRDQGKSVFDVVTLASIVEKEVRTDADRAMVADIFLKRLRDGIALQSDATVNYVTGKNTTRPSSEDVAVDSPYNTYAVRGLPPGPIANPGLAAIRAVLNPESNPYYYFLTKEDGTAVFGVTFEEHKANKAKYLR
ncbi:MAG: endolytic transglycosylase MltG [Candidatus Kerfeldbacteria bacterium]|nr:endolytic transglycosylase MltG [Candidatus Kerfeldbacteria bacterium]